MGDLNPEGKTETKHLYPGVPYLLPSNIRAAGITVLPQFVFCRNYTKLVFCLTSASPGYPERGEWESTKVQNVETFWLNSLTYFQAKLSPLPPQPIQAKIKCPSSSFSLCNFDSVRGYEFRTLYGAIWITKPLYLLLLYANISFLRNNLLIT